MTGIEFFHQQVFNEFGGGLVGQLLVKMQANQVVDGLGLQEVYFFPKPGQPPGRLVGCEILDGLWFKNDHHRWQVELRCHRFQLLDHLLVATMHAIEIANGDGTRWQPSCQVMKASDELRG